MYFFPNIFVPVSQDTTKLQNHTPPQQQLLSIRGCFLDYVFTEQSTNM